MEQIDKFVLKIWGELIIDRAGLQAHMQLEPSFWGKSRITFGQRRWFPDEGDESQPIGM